MSPDPTRIDVADVYKGDNLAGKLMRRGDTVVFAYSPDYLDSDLPAVATTIPKRDAETISTAGAVPPFFAGLLPEGRRLISLQRSLKTSPDDEFSQLVAVGADCIGDVRVLREGADPTPRMDDEPSISVPHEISFVGLFERSLDLGRDSSNQTIPGVQDKISDAMLSIPARKQGGSVILKLSPPAFPQLVENEYFFLRLAAKCGLRVPSSSIVTDRDGARGLAVERFDREFSRGRQGRIAQEDAVQLAGRWPSSKYLMSTASVFEAVLKVTPAAPVARAALLRLFIYSYMIANGDLHAKNVSVYDHPSGVWSVTPAYDLVSTLPYGDDKMALDLEGRDSNIKGSTFVRFGERLGAKERLIRKIISEITDVAEESLDDLDEIGLPERKIAHLSRTISSRITQLRS